MKMTKNDLMKIILKEVVQTLKERGPARPPVRINPQTGQIQGLPRRRRKGERVPPPPSPYPSTEPRFLDLPGRIRQVEMPKGIRKTGTAPSARYVKPGLSSAENKAWIRDYERRMAKKSARAGDVIEFPKKPLIRPAEPDSGDVDSDLDSIGKVIIFTPFEDLDTDDEKTAKMCEELGYGLESKYLLYIKTAVYAALLKKLMEMVGDIPGCTAALVAHVKAWQANQRVPGGKYGHADRNTPGMYRNPVNIQEFIQDLELDASVYKSAYEKMIEACSQFGKVRRNPRAEHEEFSRLLCHALTSMIAVYPSNNKFIDRGFHALDINNFGVRSCPQLVNAMINLGNSINCAASLKRSDALRKRAMKSSVIPSAKSIKKSFDIEESKITYNADLFEIDKILLESMPSGAKLEEEIISASIALVKNLGPSSIKKNLDFVDAVKFLKSAELSANAQEKSTGSMALYYSGGFGDKGSIPDGIKPGDDEFWDRFFNPIGPEITNHDTVVVKRESIKNWLEEGLNFAEKMNAAAAAASERKLIKNTFSFAKTFTILMTATIMVHEISHRIDFRKDKRFKALQRQYVKKLKHLYYTLKRPGPEWDPDAMNNAKEMLKNLENARKYSTEMLARKRSAIFIRNIYKNKLNIKLPELGPALVYLNRNTDFMNDESWKQLYGLDGWMNLRTKKKPWR